MNIFGREKFDWQERIAKTGFFTGIISFIVFFNLDFLIDGFVSHYFSIHWILIITIIFGIWWSSRYTKVRKRAVTNFIFAIILSAFLATVSWSITEIFEEYRVLVTLLVSITPFFLYRMLLFS
jgi:hypothetical protein